MNAARIIHYRLLTSGNACGVDDSDWTRSRAHVTCQNCLPKIPQVLAEAAERVKGSAT